MSGAFQPSTSGSTAPDNVEGRVHQVKRTWREYEDYALAQRLQDTEFQSHYLQNRSERKTVQGDIRLSKEEQKLEDTYAQEYWEQVRRDREKEDQRLAEQLQKQLELENGGRVSQEESMLKRDEELARSLQNAELSSLHQEQLRTMYEMDCGRVHCDSTSGRQSSTTMKNKIPPARPLPPHKTPSSASTPTTTAAGVDLISFDDFLPAPSSHSGPSHQNNYDFEQPFSSPNYSSTNPFANAKTVNANVNNLNSSAYSASFATAQSLHRPRFTSPSAPRLPSSGLSSGALSFDTSPPMLLNLMFVPFLLYLNSLGAEAQFEKHRCHCICPPFMSANGTGSITRKVYVGNLDAHDCNCEKLVIPEVSGIVPTERFEEFCARCQCKFQSRNTVVIQVAVIGVICVIVLLVIYMLFLLLLGPVLKRRSGAAVPYQHYKNEDDENIFASGITINTGAGSALSDTLAAASTSTSGANVHRNVHQHQISGAGHLRTRSGTESVLNRVSNEQDRWMRKVNEQRKNVFTDHKMMN